MHLNTRLMNNFQMHYFLMQFLKRLHLAFIKCWSLNRVFLSRILGSIQFFFFTDSSIRNSPVKFNWSFIMYMGSFIRLFSKNKIGMRFKETFDVRAMLGYYQVSYASGDSADFRCFSDCNCVKYWSYSPWSVRTLTIYRI